MNVDRTIKLLLLKLGKQGHDVSLIKEQRYSQEFDSVSSRYKLTFWVEGIKDKKTPITHKFNNSIDLLKYMVVKANERAAQSVR